ncbi:pilus assembly protein PilM [Halalkalibacillus halophilus]|uniref:pilus assembly protein PilM n=1 Tax=Halalkalibacillus halophilus TaxID=392827 RepID=UPI00040D0E4E|nr:pilus assembly protein PilM [Halalkalibacillus halophilus]
MSEKLFALDIGTRSVVGIMLEKVEGKYRVLDLVQEEHQERSMLDGQIHNVVAVSEKIHIIKEKLEINHGPLKQVCVAAAGRALKTIKSTVHSDISKQPLMEDEDIFHLELSAVQNAQYELAEAESNIDSNSTTYYCVGYSVLHYYLDNQEIGSLVDQQGETASIDIIATFLPKVVVESLLSALQRAGLEMEALTLEPIAAIQVLIPTSMRKLNIALVDIGAGTSDIAITSEGTITAYGMVPKAGDAITESISETYLLDFHQAEQAKRDLSNDGQMSVEDILGFENSYSSEEVMQEIAPSVDSLTNAICDQIILLNKQAPRAVMLVGGGSLTPTLPAKIASKLQIPENRVAIRNIDAIKLLDDHSTLPKSPEFVTPIGIAIAAKQSPVQYISVDVNGKMVRLFDVKQLTIGDCLLAAGIELNKLYGKPGMAMMVYMNNRKVTLPGTFGKPPQLFINGVSASIKDTISEGDHIIVNPGENGTSPKYTVEDLVGDPSGFTITLNNETIHLPTRLYVNQTSALANDQVKDGDHVQWKSDWKLGEVFDLIGEKRVTEKSGSFSITLNKQPYMIKKQQVTILLNKQPASLDQTVAENDSIFLQINDFIPVEELATRLNLNLKHTIEVTYNNEKIKLTKPNSQIQRNGELLDSTDEIFSGDHIQTKEKTESTFIFQDLFRYIDLELQVQTGQQFKLYKNQQEVGFAEPINSGDHLEIRWSKL